VTPQATAPSRASDEDKFQDRCHARDKLQAQDGDNSRAATEMAPAPATMISFKAATETLFRQIWPPRPKFFEFWQKHVSPTAERHR
jgi:hypothetical protein